ncbi:class I SAM-dependent methyltransferase [Paenibacillus humicola]|uniref:class I SAM-dependent methyltransferase n=1 Tax=Paenibacillus humicola TaxID=3110540 RepID=UPI00237A0FF8|nr:class I SAM-dependent methyltransferase [Paenibacillus humicola]
MMKRYEQEGVAVTCRSFEEYVRMFDLSEEELAAGEIVDIAAGGSSFTADAAARGLQATAVDPRYSGEPEKLVREAGEEIGVSTAKLAKLYRQYDWTYYGSLERHAAMRRQSLQRFADHFGSGQGRSRYTAGSLPDLPYEGDRFSLVLCSHFLFLYGDQFDYGFHLRSVQEMMRVCRPGGVIRIYPVMSLRFERYSRLDDLLAAIEAAGGRPELFRTRLPFIPKSEYGLLIRRPSRPKL